MTFESVLEEAKSFGLYQKLLCFLLVFYTTGLCSLTYYTQNTIFMTPPHWCWNSNMEALKDQLDLNSEDVKRFTLPQKSSGEFSQCQRFDVDAAAAYINWTAAHRPNGQDGNKYPVTYCDQWSYNYSSLFPTLTSEYNWVCNSKWKPYFIHGAFWIGSSIGALLWGYLSDRFGRRPILLIGHSVYLIGGATTLVAPEFCLILIARTIVGLSHFVVSRLPYILVLEQCGVRHRVFPLLAVMVSYSSFSMVAPWLALALPTWWWLTLVTVAPITVVLLSWKWIGESPAWYVTKGRTEEAAKVLETIARLNGRSLPTSRVNTLDTVSWDKRKYYTLLDIIRIRNLRRHSVLLGIVWISCNISYFGHHKNTAHLAPDIYTSYFYGGLLEVPCWILPFLLNKLGRRWPLIFCLSFSGFAAISYTLMPSDHTKMILGLGLLGRITVTAAFYAALQFYPEIYPTIVRGQGLGIAEALKGVTIFVSPVILYLAEYHKKLPLVVFGGFSILGAIVTIILPETANRALPHSKEDAERFDEDIIWQRCDCIGAEPSEPEIASEQVAGNAKFLNSCQSYSSLG